MKLLALMTAFAFLQTADPSLQAEAGVATDVTDAAKRSRLPAADQMPPNVRLVETVLSRRRLHQLESMGGLRLPRMDVFVADGSHVMHSVGWNYRMPWRFDAALKERNALPGGLTIDELFGFLTDRQGNPVAKPDLAGTDVVVFLYWAGWCGPCGTSLSEMRKLMAADASRRFVWVAIEADSVKQNVQRETLR
ncbi:MAG TPA: redoxin domain-containing protein [Tahibacter sp.]|uniref:peroxiredoxin family protein n=1 Tax=Tahibacter sp. TaxID=2056211 RepID=UPI002BE5FF4C|nr:redoxin domain-containing protein [Tahibacter sp.]HSX60587.1 redoxin domain-containing protein [Tahibacter sp.]